MTRRDGVWIGFATLFTLANAATAGFYAIAEPAHAGAHALLMAAGVAWVWWLASRMARRPAVSLPVDAERLEKLQQSMDAVALEVERIGEGQRFAVKLEAEKREKA